LSDVLSGDLPLQEALIWIPEYRLTPLPAGRPTSQPTELLGSSEMRRTVDALRMHFDRIVIDTPPALTLADVGVVGPLSDGVLLIVRAGQTPRPAIERALRQVAPARVLGLVLNDVGETESSYAYGRTYGRHHGGRAAEHGV
jgi:protein-tyrosine kinase